MALPGGELLEHMTLRRRRELIDLAFEQMGGLPRLVDAFNKSDETAREFFIKLWGKGIPRPVAVDPGAGGGMEDMIKRLEDADRAERATIIGESHAVDDDE